MLAILLNTMSMGSEYHEQVSCKENPHNNLCETSIETILARMANKDFGLRKLSVYWTFHIRNGVENIRPRSLCLPQ